MTAYTTARHVLDGLVEIGVGYVFCNLGTDHVTLIEEWADAEAEGRPAPKPILCPHENVAVHMAGGYALATGRGQAVMVHVDAGTANASMGMHNLFRARIPVMLMAGKAPFTIRGELLGSRDNYVHFVQDPFDIVSLVRPYVKWDYNLASGIVAKEALRRGHSAMHSDPAGPVYMTLPREVLAASWEEDAVASFPESRFGPVRLGGIDPDTADMLAARIMAARNPIVITSYLGRKAEAVVALDELARACGIRVVEFGPVHLSIPRDSPCFDGFDPVSAMAEADLGLMLDVDVPFLPAFAPRAAEIPWLQIDLDPLKKDFPMWGFGAEVRIQADCAIALRQVLAAVRRRGDAAYEESVRARMTGWEGRRGERRRRVEAAAATRGERDAISVDSLAAALNERLSPDDVLVNEAIRNTGAILNQVERTRPGTYVGLAGGGLGFSGGMALGIKLARPDVRVVQVVGDGGFHFSTPDAVYAVAQQYGLPILTIVLDNGGWQAVKEAVLRVHPGGRAARTDAFLSRLGSGRQGDRRRFEDVARAFGAYGESVDEPDAVPAALDRCFAALANGQAAVLSVRVTPL